MVDDVMFVSDDGQLDETRSEEEGNEIPYVLPGGPGRLVMDVQPSLSHPGDRDLTVQHRSPLSPSGES